MSSDEWRNKEAEMAFYGGSASRKITAGEFRNTMPLVLTNLPHDQLVNRGRAIETFEVRRVTLCAQFLVELC